MGAFRKLGEGHRGGRLWMGVGFLGVTAGFVILSYYSVVAGWTLNYIVMALRDSSRRSRESRRRWRSPSPRSSATAASKWSIIWCSWP